METMVGRGMWKASECLRRRPLRAIVAGTLVALVVAVLAVGVAQRLILPAERNPAATQPDFVPFRDTNVGFSFSYPQAWKPIPDPDPQVKLLASNDAAYSFQVRVLSLQSPIVLAQLPAAQQVTNQIVLSNNQVKLIAEPQQITLGGLPGYFYLYTFTDPQTGQTGAHSHFFLFKGNSMITLVFQAVPAEMFRAGSTTFDQITSSFQG
jgi:hypothetical protein